MTFVLVVANLESRILVEIWQLFRCKWYCIRHFHRARLTTRLKQGRLSAVLRDPEIDRGAEAGSKRTFAIRYLTQDVLRYLTRCILSGKKYINYLVINWKSAC
jgi:hypothetical protein